MPAYVIAVVMVICTVVHIKKNTITEELTMKRAMIRFAVLLLLINFVTLFANALPAAHFVLPDLITPTAYVILKAFTYIFLCIPVVATPVLMMAIFKPVSKAVKEVVTCKSCIEGVRVSKVQLEGSSSSGQALLQQGLQSCNASTLTPQEESNTQCTVYIRPHILSC